MMHRYLPILLPLMAASTAMADDAVSFRRDVLPLLSDRCFTCHGPDAEKREADLRLDEEAGAKQSVIVPGKANESELYLRITSDDPDERMPPPYSKHDLKADEIRILERWINAGAPWERHWAFEPLGRVDVPQAKGDVTIRNELDAFIIRRLQAEGLSPSQEATRERLLRRISFDLTGLPPTLDEVTAFLQDDRPDAYEQVVDRLLNSDAFGERMAADWLDVARYSDTYGYQVDRDRFVWPWRDWVIRAFNSNMPYDQFITEQLAGDLLPDATDDQILATTFSRLHPQKVEGGSTPEEFRVEYVSDRTQTFGTAFLGLTLECCRCHDHKYDPISQKEYYQLTAFFDNIDEAGLYSYFTSSVPTPTLALTDDQTKTRLAELRRSVADAERELDRVANNRDDAFKAWLANAEVDDAKLIPGEIAVLDFEGKPSGRNIQAPGRFGQAVRLTGDDGVGLSVGNFRRFDPFSISLWLNTPDVKDRAVVFHRSRAWTDAGSRGYQLLIEDGRLSASLIHFWPGNAIRVRTQNAVPTESWHHVAVTWDGSSRPDGLNIFVDGKPAECDVVRGNLYKNISGGGGDNITIGQRFRDRGFTDGLVDEFRVYNRQLTPLEVAQLFDGSALQDVLSTAVKKQQAADSLKAYYLSTVDSEYQQSLKELRAAREKLCKASDGLQEIMVMREQKTPRQTYLLKRGAYDARTEKVEPETPASLPAFPADAPRNRLGLARWLTSPDHPLTSRVAVNRFWQAIFGDGLVRTPEDFGRQGERPTHEELLNWLARDFMDHGWDVKRLLKQIVMSSPYRQSPIGSVKALKDDPSNVLLARSPAYRLSAEMLRDNALAVSGLLVDKQGGPPARPYEVEVSFKPSKRASGEGLYRRSLYTYWKRTGPAPVMMTLDASKRDVCRMRRERTSTPLEAFVLMNGPQFVEAARTLAERALKQNESDDGALKLLFRSLTCRSADEHELQIIRDLYAAQRSYFESDRKHATSYLSIGDRKPDSTLDPVRLAALSSVANALFSFDEVVNRR